MIQSLCLVFRLGAWSFTAFTFFTYLFLPMESVWSRLGLPREFIEKHFITLPVFFALLTLLSLLCARFFELWNQLQSPQTEEKTFFSPMPPQPIAKWKAPFLIGLASLVFIRALAGIEQPFDNDELTLAFSMVEGTSLGPLLHNATHPLSSYLGALSTKLFGLSFFSIRLPALFFCVIFLFVLVRFCIAYVGIITSTLLIGHLASSSIFVWYFHSTRGYAPMVLFCFIIFSIGYSITVQGEKMNRWKWIGLISSSILMPLTHGFGILFALFFPFSLAIWTISNHKTLASPHKKTIFHTTGVLLLLVPYLAFCLGYMFYLEAVTGNKYVGIVPGSSISKETFLSALTMVLGSSHLITIKILLLLTVWNLFYLLRQKEILKDFSLLVVTVFMGFILTQRLLLSTYITGRFLLGILPIFIFWLVHTIERAWKPKALSFVFPLVLAVLVLFPLYDGSPGLFQLPHDNFYSFMRSAKKTLSGISTSCIDFSNTGVDPAFSEAFIAKHYYFAPNRASVGTECTNRYQLHFSWAWPSEDPTKQNNVGTFEQLPPEKKYKLLHTDGAGRFIAIIDPKGVVQ